MKFSELAIGDNFTYKGVEYKKISPIKVSCCKTWTAIKVADNQKIMIKPNEIVEKINAN